MKEPYGEGVASHTDPESCVVSREAGREALTGAHVDGVLSREITGMRHTRQANYCELLELLRCLVGLEDVL
ncbi:MAG: hypothetical protein DMG55_14770 [Acidobacteria bacterium]|nr:MAG: hypothetical protein DMG55_14770 [Acidobacteriota bacterium]